MVKGPARAGRNGESWTFQGAIVQDGFRIVKGSQHRLGGKVIRENGEEGKEKGPARAQQSAC